MPYEKWIGNVIDVVNVYWSTCGSTYMHAVVNVPIKERSEFKEKGNGQKHLHACGAIGKVHRCTS